MTLKFMLLLLLKAVVTLTAGKYVFHEMALNWFDAQTYCRTHHTDLAPINSEFDVNLIDKMDLDLIWLNWIGLMKTSNSSSGWMWSGGGEVSKFFWKPRNPDNYYKNEDHGAMAYKNYLWDDQQPLFVFPFVCYEVHAIRKRMTWDEALQYCRKNHNDLASVASETEMMLMERELRKELSTVNIWIGLQFMDGTWQWMDGQPFSYESWGAGEKPVCPVITFECGALEVKGQPQKVGQEILANVSRVEGWKARDCNRKLHFLCY